MKRVKTGIIGCGNISSVYLKNLTTVFRDTVELAACADHKPEAAAAKAKEFGVPKACSVKELLADPEIELVIDLTVPNSHYDVNMAILNAGKNLYTEKPLAATRREGEEIIRTAAKAGLLVGGAPDTFLGAGLATCRDILDSGAIGEPVAATAFRSTHGPEDWHPNPEFFYKPGAGPLFDVGPYDLTALVSLLGPVAKVSSVAKASFPTRTVTSEPYRGEIIKVEVPTHVTGLLDFECGATATLIASFDLWATKLPFIEIYGTKGTLSVPDANNFTGSVQVFRSATQKWEEAPVTRNYSENSRGLGAADLAASLRSGAKPRAGGELIFHVLDVMQSIIEASAAEKTLEVKSTCERPRSFDGIRFD